MYSVNELQPYLQPTLGLIAVTIPALGELQKTLTQPLAVSRFFTYQAGKPLNRKAVYSTGITDTSSK